MFTPSGAPLNLIAKSYCDPFVPLLGCEAGNGQKHFLKNAFILVTRSEQIAGQRSGASQRYFGTSAFDFEEMKVFEKGT